MAQLPMISALVVTALAGASPAPRAGLYRGGDLGLLDVSLDGSRFSGRYISGGACHREPDQQVVRGRVEGGVLVGKVLLCQTGPGCGDKSYPLLAFVGPGGTGWVGKVKLEPGCGSPALKGAQLSLQPGGSSPASRRAAHPRRVFELQKRALLAARRALEAGDAQEAAQQFELAISYNDANWPAHFGLGVAEFKRGQVMPAIEALERARQLALEGKQTEPDISFHLACAWSQVGQRAKAMAHLREAVKDGFVLTPALASDPALRRTLGDDPEFQRLTAEVAARGKPP